MVTPALEAFLVVITAPAEAVSNFTVEALKKAKLVSLIDEGAALLLPKYTSNIVTRFAKQDAGVYDSLSRCFSLHDASGLERAFSEGAEVLARDGNTGLGKKAVFAYTKHSIRKLTETYITLSLRWVGLEG